MGVLTTWMEEMAVLTTLRNSILKIPKKLGHFVIDSFDEYIMGIRSPRKIIKITEKPIYNLIEILNSGIDLGSIVPSKDLDTILFAWKDIYDNDYISPFEIVTRIIKDGGDDSFFFQVDFLVLFLATMVECYSHDNLIYIDFVQCNGMTVDPSVSPLEFWDVDLLQEREAQEIKSGGFGGVHGKP
ncbi:hypothetical protein L1987_54413 [Smallanthus sonchifolius]|uniref:Uncharacterized protein n=1 Tax=Smallanthus sonchifolius TaxID=185202 RepID=A0ACB9E7C6_9ASTR|nr:hypothetical protein L1987_54413 [Smallanthus sonchifolius]